MRASVLPGSTALAASVERPRRLRAALPVGAVLHVAAALLWLPQAALLALALQRLADGTGLAGVQGPAAGLLLLGVLRSLCDMWGQRRVFAAARLQVSALRARLADALAARSPLDRARPASGLAASAMAEQAEAVLPYLVRYQPARWRVATLPLLIVLAVAALSWVAALILLLAAPLIPLFMALVGWRAKAASEVQLAGLGDMHAFLLDRLRGLATLRALGAVEATAVRLRAAAELLRERTMAVLRIAFLSSAVLELFAALGVAMVAVYVGFHLLGQLPFGAWGRGLSLGQGMFILLLAPAFFEPLRELSAAWHDRAAGVAALDAIEGWCARASEARSADAVAEPVGGVPASSAPPALCRAVAVHVAGLHFTHHGGTAALFEGFELNVAAGEQIALVGDSGCGKSTLLALIAGLAPWQAGRVLIDGAAMAPGTAAVLRACMAWVAQKPHVFAGSVRTNIVLGRPGVDRSALTSALALASLGSVAQAQPDVALGEGGAGLSGGEVVRLALARAAVHTGAGLLLVDEPTAHLDSETAAQVTDALLRLARGRTLIVATHDDVLAARLQRTVRLGPAVGTGQARAAMAPVPELST